MCRCFIQIVIWILERIPQRCMVRNCGCHWHCKIQALYTGFTWEYNFIFPFRGILAGAPGHRHSVRPVTDAFQKNWKLHHSRDWLRYRWHWHRRIRPPPAFRRPPQGSFHAMFSTRLLISLFRFLTFFMRTAVRIGTQQTCMGKGKL
jgi:hypothetical protein